MTSFDAHRRRTISETFQLPAIYTSGQGAELFRPEGPLLGGYGFAAHSGNRLVSFAAQALAQRPRRT